MHALSTSEIPTYSKQLTATEKIVMRIPRAVLHHPTVSIAEDGHKITRRSV